MAPAFKVELISEKYKNIMLSHPAQFICRQALADVPPTAAGHSERMIIVPAFGESWDLVRQKIRR